MYTKLINTHTQAHLSLSVKNKLANTAFTIESKSGGSEVCRSEEFTHLIMNKH